MPKRNYKRYRRGYNRYPKSSYSLARKAYSIAKKNQMAKELKYLTTTFNGTVGTSGNLIDISDVSLGDTNNDRDGNVINPTSVKLRICMEINSSSPETLVRVIIFQWLRENPTGIADYLEAISIDSFKSDVKRFESKTLYDRVYKLSDSGNKNIYDIISRKLHGMITYPDASTNANKNQTFVALLSDDNTNQPTINFSARLYFKDP